MITNMYSVFDSKAGAFLQPFFLPSDGVAIRAMQDCTSDPSHMFHRHAEDYALFRLGSFDDQAGKFEILPAPLHLQNLVVLLRPSLKAAE